MKILILYRLTRYIITYHLLSSLVIFLALEVKEASGRSDLKTKLLLQSIRTHMAQKTNEIVKKKECESGLVLCVNLKKKDEEEDEEKAEEIPPPLKLPRGQHKQIFKVSTKDAIQTLPRVHKNLFRKAQKIGQDENQREKFLFITNSEHNLGKGKSVEIATGKVMVTRKLPKLLKQSPKTKENFEKSSDVNLPKISKELKEEVDLQKDKKPRKNKIKIEKEEIPIKRKMTVEKTRIERKIEKVKKDKKEDVSSDKKVRMEDDLIFQSRTLVFVLNSTESNNNLCEKHSQIYVKQLKKYQIWALMMYDASAKLTSGILQGNTNQYGDFDECLSINAVFKKSKNTSKEQSGIKGKYCLANIDVTTDSESENLRSVLERAKGFQFIKSSIQDPGHFIPRFSTINWGLCVPSTCLAEDVETFLRSRFEVFTNILGLHFDFDVDESNCVVKDDLKFQFQIGTILTIMFYFAVLIMSLYATFIDTKMKKKNEEPSEEEIELKLAEAAKDISLQEELETREGLKTAKLPLQNKTKKILLAFSIKKNVEKLLSENNKGAIECINGVKSIFTVMLYLAHKTIPLGMTPFTNRVLLTKISYQPITILLRASIIYTDSFLLISGILTSYNLAKEISEKKKISWIKKSIGRFIRLTPALFAVILFYAYVWDLLGSGPIWNLIVNKNSSLCRKYLWRNLLYIQNLFAFENMCAPQTHQLALDMQLSLLAPLLVHLIHTYDKAGVGILQALFILSSILRYISAFNNELSIVIYHGMSVSQLYKTANLLYGQTFHRASPYIMGTIVGYYLKKFEKQFDIPRAFSALGWILSFTFGFYSIVSSSHLALKTYEYDVQEAAQYAALSPVAWSLALSWVITACHLGYGGILNNFLCKKIFLIFSRISYSVYLTQFLVFFYKVGVKRFPEVFTLSGSFSATEFFLIIGISVIVTLFFDIPMMEIKKIILDKNSLSINPFEASDVENNVYSEQSKEFSQTKNEKESEEIIPEEAPEELTGTIEEEDEYQDEGGNESRYKYENENEEEDENEEADVSGDEVIDDSEGDDEEVFEIRPLRRSLRRNFRDDSDDVLWQNPN